MSSSIPSSRFGRRQALGAGLALLAAAAGVRAQQPAGTAVEVWKDPNCGCCKDWVKHLEDNGFKVKVNETGNSAARARLGIDAKYGSCHTAVVDGYALEGHVPAREIRRLLKERPAAVGLAVPGMPVGSPGMDGAIYEGRSDAYDVVLLGKDGSAKVYQHYAANRRRQASAAPATVTPKSPSAHAFHTAPAPRT